MHPLIVLRLKTTLLIILIALSISVSAAAQVSLTIRTNIDSARVYIGERLAGHTPLTLRLSQYGSVTFRLNADGYFDKTVDVNVQEDSAHVHIELEKASRLKVITRPRQAKLYLNDSLFGETPLLFPKIHQKLYSVRISKENYIDHLSEADLTANTDLTIDKTLNRKQCLLSFSGARGIADVVLEGEESLYSFSGIPDSVMSIDVDRYHVSVSKEGYWSFNSEYDLRMQSVTIPVSLQPKSIKLSYLLGTVLPGAGQLYMGRGQIGWPLATAAVISIYGVFRSLQDYDKSKQSFNVNRELYLSAQTNYELALYYGRQKDLHSDMDKSRSQFFLFGSATALLYLYSIADVLLFEPEELQGNGLSISTIGQSIRLSVPLQ